MAFVRSVELRARSVVVLWCWVAVSCRSVVVLCRSMVGCGRVPFPLFGELGGFCGVIGTSVFAFVYIFRYGGRVLSAWQHRAVGGSSDGGVKGIPLNNPHFG